MNIVGHAVACLLMTIQTCVIRWMSLRSRHLRRELYGASSCPQKAKFILVVTFSSLHYNSPIGQVFLQGMLLLDSKWLVFSFQPGN